MRSPYLHISTIFVCNERFLVAIDHIHMKCSPFVRTVDTAPDDRGERIDDHIANLCDTYFRMSVAHAK